MPVLLFGLATAGCSGGGASAGTGGSSATGGQAGSGGASATGGMAASGGATGSGGSQGGGAPGSGGVSASGGASGSGGGQGGGGQGSGGQGSGGQGTGGRATGGVSGGGGAQGSGGTRGSGGATSTSTENPDAGSGPDAPLGGSDAAPDLATEPRKQAPRPQGDAGSCGAWAMTEGVCCAQYCSDDDRSESCDKCGGPGSAKCQVVNAKACTSGQWPEVREIADDEPWHYSRSTHFGTAPTGACAFGVYGICSELIKLANTNLQAQCDVFCKAYPDLCKDPSGITLRGNFAAPQGNYYTQFWSSLPGDLDNYLSCGECFELVRTQDDGSEYPASAPEHTPPIVLQIADSCPCSANSKWCCGSGRDHCGEVKDTFKYGCQLPPSPPDPPPDHDPLPNESIHLDLSDIAMGRLQTGDPSGAMPAGVVPTKYRRVPCPVVGNIHIWLRPNGNEYYFALTVVNMAGLGAAARVEARLPSGEWVALQRDKNYSLSRPQERFGTWALPQGYGPFQLPVTLRFTDGGGRVVVAQDLIKAWAPSDKTLSEMWFIDTGVQF